MNQRIINQMLLTTIISCLLICSNILFAQVPKSMQALNSKQQNIVAIAAYTGKGDLTNLKTALNEGLIVNDYFCFTNIITGLSSSSNLEAISFNLPSFSWPFL